MTGATRSTKPRSSTGADVPRGSRRPTPRPAAERRPARTKTNTRAATSQQQKQRQRRTEVSNSESENPVIPSPTPAAHRPRTNQDWWPNQLDLSVLNQHSPRGNPMGEDF